MSTPELTHNNEVPLAMSMENNSGKMMVILAYEGNGEQNRRLYPADRDRDMDSGLWVTLGHRKEINDSGVFLNFLERKRKFTSITRGYRKGKAIAGSYYPGRIYRK